MHNWNKVLLSLSIALLLSAGCTSQVQTVQVTATPSPTTAAPPTAIPHGPVTVTVCASGCDFVTIQAAIDADETVAGSTIDVLDLTHTEAGITIAKDVTIQGQGADRTTIQAHANAGDATDRVFLVQPDANVAIRNLTVRHGYATLEPYIPGLRRCGGGIVNQGLLTLDAVVVRDNVASCGGGIWNKGTMTITHSTISNNTSDGYDPNPGHGCGSGGGIMHIEGPLTITTSTITNNTSVGRGGGLHISCAGTAVVANSTVSGNFSDSRGGGIHVKGVLTMTFSTVAANSAADQVGGIYNRGTVYLSNSLVANNAAGDCLIGSNESGRRPGSFGENRNNLIQDNSCSPDRSGDPLLGDLADNGGPAQTHALLPNSPALNVVPPEQCDLAVDQRGIPRPQGTGCDIGAFEQTE